MNDQDDMPSTKLIALRTQLIRIEVYRFFIASLALIIIGVATLLLTVLAATARIPEVGWTTVALLGFATLCFSLPLFRKIGVKKEGGEFETTSPIALIAEILDKEEAARKELIQQTDQQIGAVADQMGELSDSLSKALETLGRNEAASHQELSRSVLDETYEPTLREIQNRLPPPTNKEDPQKNRFGGQESTNGRRLVAETKPSALGKEWRKVILKVEVTNNQPLEGEYVCFFLHDTFKPDAYRVKVDHSRKFALLDVDAIGAFTVGAVSDKGKTVLELDLTTSSSVQAPLWWRNR